MDKYNSLNLYGFYESPEKVTHIELPVWRIRDSNDEIIAICFSEVDAWHLSAALNAFQVEGDGD